jgi:tetratricopeptide (TPR) repeat protein
MTRHPRSVLSLIAFAIILAASLYAPARGVAQASELTFRLTPGAALPLGADREFFGTGVQTQLEGTLTPGFLPVLVGSFGAGYALTPLGIDTGLSLVNGSAALAARFQLGETMWVEAGGGGGYYFGFLNDGRTPGSGGGFVRGGAGIYRDISPLFALGLVAEYRNYLGLGQFVSIGLSGTVRTGRAALPAPIQVGPNVQPPRPLSEAAAAELLQIHDAELSEVFPVFFKYYNEHPVGTATITNVGEEALTGITMSLFVADYMDNATACQAPTTLAPGESATVTLSSFFNERVLSIEQSTIKSAELAVAFDCDGDEYERTYTHTLRLHDRNSMTWDDLNKPAAYVTPRDASVLALSRHVSAIARESHQGAVHPSLRTAIALHTAIDLYGTTYTPDPTSPYRRLDTELAIDYLQFPRQTLAYRAGDCDDLSILYCSLLESLSIPTAMVLVPGHIFIAFNLQISPSDARSQFARAEDLIFHNDETWIPLEITSISDGFIEAWQTGAREWREAVARDQETLIVTADAWQTYETVGLPYEEQNLDLPDKEAIRTAYTAQVTEYIDQTIYPLVARLQAQMAERGRTPALVNRLAILYARYGLFDRARRELDNLLIDNPNYAPALANMGNILYQEGDLVSAERNYQMALLQEPDNPSILICLARVSHDLENYGTADRSFDRVKELNPELAAQFAYLDLRGDDAARAAEIGGLADQAYWVEEEEAE